MDEITLALMGLAAALAGLVSAFVFGAVKSWSPFWRERHYARGWERVVETDHELALIEDNLYNTLMEVEHVVHYRHNIHCPACGRFARQAEGFPASVADCNEHGVVARSEPHTGAIPIIVQEIEAPLGIEIPTETSPLYIQPPVEAALELEAVH